MKIFDKKTILITGGTGSLGQVLTKRLLSGKHGVPKKIIIFSRDEAKQHYMRLDYLSKRNITDEVIYNNFRQLLEFRIGDIRDYHTVVSLLPGVDIVINAAALKQVPSCEYFPIEAVKTNILGPNNIIRAIHEYNFPVSTVVGVSTDKACKPINVMGMTKALQERVFIEGNIIHPKTRFVCVRYGNVLASRGSVIPLFLDQIKSGGPVTITTEDMTRFLLPLEKAVDVIIAAITSAKPGETYIPIIGAASMVDLAKALINHRNIKIAYTGIRPGEKVYETLVAAEEAWRTIKRGSYYVIQSMLPEIAKPPARSKALTCEYNSSTITMSVSDIRKLLIDYDLLSVNNDQGDLLA